MYRNIVTMDLSPTSEALGSLYREADIDGDGIVNSTDALKFFPRYNLPNPVLGKIWGMADKAQTGILSKENFSVAMRLIAKALQGKELTLDDPPQTGFSMNPNMPRSGSMNMGSVSGMGGGSGSNLGTPKMGATPQNTLPPMMSLGANAGNTTYGGISPSLGPSAPRQDLYTITPADRTKYGTFFEKAGGNATGFVTGDKARNVFMQSNLPTNILAKIWELSDVDGDGNLDLEEFGIAMHLLNLAIKKIPIPDELPVTMQKGTNITPPTPNLTGSFTTPGSLGTPMVPSLNLTAGNLNTASPSQFGVTASTGFDDGFGATTPMGTNFSNDFSNTGMVTPRSMSVYKSPELNEATQKFNDVKKTEQTLTMQISRSEATNQSLGNRIKEIQDNTAKREQLVEQLKAQLESLQNEEQELQNQMHTLSAQYDTLGTDRSNTEAKISQLQARINVGRRKLESFHSQSMGTNQEQQRLVMMLHQLEPEAEKVEAEVMRIQGILQAQLEDIEATRTELDMLTRNTAEIKAQKENLQQQYQHNNQQSGTLRQQVDAARRENEEIKQELANLSTTKAEYQNATKEVEGALLKLLAEKDALNTQLAACQKELVARDKLLTQHTSPLAKEKLNQLKTIAKQAQEAVDKFVQAVNKDFSDVQGIVSSVQDSQEIPTTKVAESFATLSLSGFNTGRNSVGQNASPTVNASNKAQDFSSWGTFDTTVKAENSSNDFGDSDDWGNFGTNTVTAPTVAANTAFGLAATNTVTKSPIISPMTSATPKSSTPTADTFGQFGNFETKSENFGFDDNGFGDFGTTTSTVAASTTSKAAFIPSSPQQTSTKTPELPKNDFQFSSAVFDDDFSATTTTAATTSPTVVNNSMTTGFGDFGSFGATDNATNESLGDKTPSATKFEFNTFGFGAPNTTLEASSTGNDEFSFDNSFGGSTAPSKIVTKTPPPLPTMGNTAAPTSTSNGDWGFGDDDNFDQFGSTATTTAPTTTATTTAPTTATATATNPFQTNSNNSKDMWNDFADSNGFEDSVDEFSWN